MKEMFTWVPWFTELARKIADGGEEYLNERAKRVDWGSEGRSLVEPRRRPTATALLDRKSIDPLTFVAYLATRSKGEQGGKSTFLSIGQEFELSNSQLAEGSAAWDLPRSHNLFWDYKLGEDERNLAWMIFQEATRGSVDPTTFDDAQAIKNIALQTLSSLLFLVSPRSFLPLLEQPEYLRAYGLTSVPQKMSWKRYSSEIKRIEDDYPGCELFEIELFARLQRPEKEGGHDLVLRTDRCWLVSTRLGEPGKRRDHWSDNFQLNNWVQTGRNYEGLSDATSGDIVLARCGVTESRGIGVVLENGYERGWTLEDAIHVLWLNKMPADLRSAARAATTPSQQTGRDAFSRATPNATALFKACAAYRPTWRLLDRITFRREVEGALQEDRTDLGETWRLKKDGKKKADIRSVVGNEPAVSQTLDLLLKGNMPTAPTMRTQVAQRVRGLRDRHLSHFSEATRRKLTELASNCDNEPPGDEQGPEPGTPSRAESGTEAPRVRHDLNQILYGPPGTGKTYETVSHALAIVDGTGITEVANDDKQRFRELRFKAGTDPNSPTEGRIATITFHQNYAYEDFVEGIRPKLAEDDQGAQASGSASTDLAYELRHGIFRRLSEAAENEPDQPFVLIIDEINRGNIPKIFGELITLIESSKRLGKKDGVKVTLPYSGDDFGVPDNLYIIGTMNTADRSIQQLDTALRRRFTFVEMMPDPDHSLIPDDVAGVNCRKMLRAMNERIALLMDREHQIGHTYLLEVESIEDLADRFRNRIFPLLQEYFYDDWRRIDAVLGGNAFVQKDKARDGHSKQLIEKFDLLDEDRVIHERLADNDPAWKAAEEYQRIYEPKSD